MSAGPVRRYFNMLGRETAIPGWMGNKNAEENLEDYNDEGSLKSDQSKNFVSTRVVSDDSVDFNTPVLRPDDKLNGDIDVEYQGTKRKGLGKYWAIIATGAGLFSDGYVNNGAGQAVTMLKTIYPKSDYSNNTAMSNIASIIFVGTVVGQLVFGYVADYYSRKAGMLISTVMLIVFSILCAGSWGVGMPDHPGGMFAMLTTFRALLGLGIGGEYPAGSTACAEVSQTLKSGSRNRWFIWFTNFMIDFGFVVSAFVGWLLLYICSVPTFATVGNSHGLQAAWRLLLGLGAIAPLSLFYLRLKYDESEQFNKNNFTGKKTPYWLSIKRYGPRLIVVSLIWFIYDFCTYSFSIYSSQIINSQIKTNADGIANIKTTFGWNVVFNLFYIPGSFLGGFSSDYFGPRLTLFTGTLLQGIVGFIMASQYNSLMTHIAPLVVAYGIFETLGEFGPGDNIGLVCSKTCASAIRGRYYSIAAATGKIGAFVGGYAFPAIADHYGGLDSNEGQTVLLYVSSALCVFSALLVLLLPEITQESIALEDVRFRNYLKDNGFDPDQLEGEEAMGADFGDAEVVPEPPTGRGF